MLELALFDMLELIAAAGIIYGSFLIHQQTESRAWRLIAASGVLIAVKSFFQAFMVFTGLKLGMLEMMFAPCLAVLLSGAGISFMRDMWAFDHVTPDHLAGYVVGAVIGLLAIGLAVPPYVDNGFLYIGTPFLLLPALYSFYRVQKEGKSVIFQSVFASTLMYFVASLMNLYLAATCFKCSLKAYSFYLPMSIPSPEVLGAASFSSPVLEMTGTFMLGFAVYLYYHGVYRKIESPDKNTSVGLLESTVENIGAVTGEDVARRIAENTLQEHFKDTGTAEEIADEEDIEEVKKALEEGFSSVVGPFARRKIQEIYEEELEV
ncbi:MAG: hypothetical protein ABEJ93_03425 [Candidatus Nanohalobium sp.]